MSPIETAGVTFAGPKGRRSMVVKLIAGETAWGAASRLAWETVVFCMIFCAHIQPNWAVTDISKAVNCGTR